MPNLALISPEVTLKFPGLSKYTGPIFDQYSGFGQINLAEVENWLHSSLNVINIYTTNTHSTTNNNSNIHNTNNIYNELNLNYTNFRNNMEAIITAINGSELKCFTYNNSNSYNISNICEKFVIRLIYTIQRSKYIDNINELIIQFIIPYECIYYITKIYENDLNSVTAASTSSASSATPSSIVAIPVNMNSFSCMNSILLYFDLLPYTIHTSHNSDPSGTENDEYTNKLLKISVYITKRLLPILNIFILSKYNKVYEYYNILSKKLYPIEAGARLEYMMTIKKGTTSKTTTGNLTLPLPGHESDLSITLPSTDLFQELVYNISTLMNIYDKHRYIQVYTYKTDLYVEFRENLCIWVRDKIRHIYFNTTTNNMNMNRWVYIRYEINVLYHSIQSILIYTNILYTEFNIIIRDILTYEHLNTTSSLPRIGVPLPFSYSNLQIPDTSGANANASKGDVIGNLKMKYDITSLISTLNRPSNKAMYTTTTTTNSINNSNNNSMIMPSTICRIAHWFEYIIDVIYQPKSPHVFLPLFNTFTSLPSNSKFPFISSTGKNYCHICTQIYTNILYYAVNTYCCIPCVILYYILHILFVIPMYDRGRGSPQSG